ncbi:SDR family oxidoreductase [Streptomyces sp. XM4193]|uniref:SDR family oxidoreductase n=1 Tax=Streptomyces sp. XM4193 TaxID=2929782 RepID=UPI001FFA0240|nr:SDR family oxidoreductase [Streptomyces sp. XM4193]MCK1796270.1 SDR family oxidoreductase [Streptomyces sp. XM4193]
MTSRPSLTGRIALVAGATRGAGRAIAVELGRAGATVYVTGRTTRTRVSEVGRATETIEETAELVTAAGGTGIAVPTDHLVADQVRDLLARVDREHGRLDILVNDLWGGDHLLSWDTPVWEHDLQAGLRQLRLGVEAHLVTSHYALPLLIRHPGGLLVEVTDGTAEYNADHYRENVYYDLAKCAPIRLAYGIGSELARHGATAVCVSPGWLRSEAMLDTHFKVTEENWREGIEQDAGFAVSESPTYVARGLAALAADPRKARFNRASLSSGDLAGEYGVTDTDGSQPDCWRYLLAADKDPTTDPEDYR